MKALEINQLIKTNDTIKKAYNQFRKEYPHNKVIDMWEMCHFIKSIEEVVIEFIDCIGIVRHYVFIEEL